MEEMEKKLSSLQNKQGELIVALEKLLQEKDLELQQTRQLFDEYKQESTELENVLQQSADLYEKESENQKEQNKMLELKFEEELAKTKLELLMKIKNIETDKLEMAKQLEEKQQIIDNFYNQNTKITQSSEEKVDENPQETIKLLRQELNKKDAVIKDLSNDFEKSKNNQIQQNEMFKKLTLDMQKFREQQQKLSDTIELTKNQEIEEMQKLVAAKDVQIEKLKQSLGTEEEGQELSTQVQTQLQQINGIKEDFKQFKIESENLSNKEKQKLVDRIKELESQLPKNNEEKSTENKQ